MTATSPATEPDAAAGGSSTGREAFGPAGSSRYHGFSLNSVCWGYRDVFRRTIETLFAAGHLGEGRPEITETFFAQLKHADQSCYDHVLRRFLGSINPRTQWVLDLPAIFVDVVELGHAFASVRPHHGVAFYELFGQGGLGDTPERVREALTHARRLRQVDPDVAMAFLRGYRRLIDRLSVAEVGLYIESGLAAFGRNRRAGVAFMEGALESSELTIQGITREARLDDVSGSLGLLLRALSGVDVALQDLGHLDSDELLERGTGCVCMYRWLYLPSRVRRFGTRSLNAAWYRLATVVSAAALGFDSFSRLHGHPDFPTCEALVGTSPLRVNAFLIGEWLRVLSRLRESWPGACRLLRLGFTTEQAAAGGSASVAERLFMSLALGEAPEDDLAAVGSLLQDLAGTSVNVFDTARRVDTPLVDALARLCPDLGVQMMRPLGFLPDFLFPGKVSTPPSDRLIADLKQQADSAADKDPERRPATVSLTEQTGGSEHAEGDEEEESVPACFLYDEWSHEEQDYYREHCCLREAHPGIMPGVTVPEDIAAEGRRVSRAFERLRPDLARKEKYLQEGDEINADLLVNFLVKRREDPAPRVDFYEKPRINRRSLAVLVLLDASGSTGERSGREERIIDLEKRAAVILGQGLSTLGDRFAVCGFSSNGREHCVYSIYKDFTDAWSGDAMQRVMGATPANSTRIGPALRHAGYRMQDLEARRRLIILITDGRPMDTGYDPNSRYAQHDVRMACEENARRGIHTFAISTQENSVADMEIMFPGRRFVILPDISDLPRLLPVLYTRLTVS